jgi:phosphate transport system protein
LPPGPEAAKGILINVHFRVIYNLVSRYLGFSWSLDRHQNCQVNDLFHFGILSPEWHSPRLGAQAGTTRLLFMGEHRQEFQRELEAIEAKVIELFAMVAEDLPTATQALLRGNNEAAQVLAERDQIIDALYTETDELVSREILLQAPVASDLRFLLSVLRIVPEIERSHDLVVEIARQANHLLSEDLSPRSRGLVERMGNVASNMWRQAADAWYKRDRTAAFALEECDDEMDELHASLIAELASGRMTLPVTMEMTVVARLYERLGDHAVNIARRVVYLAGSNPKVAGPGS